MPRWTAIAHPGLEAVVAREVQGEGLDVAVEPGGVIFDATLSEGAALAHRLRCPDRLLVEVATGPARSLDELATLVKKADWTPFLRPHGSVGVHATSRKSRLHHRGAIEKKVGFALKDALRGSGPAAAEGSPPQRVQLRLDADQASLSVCAGGELLHRRGWRSMAGKAPLRENLAASMLLAAGWSGDEPLYDPFCGSGTLLIEAALLAQGRSPFVGRSLACATWPALGRWRPTSTPSRPLDLPLVGSDHEPRALDAAREQARAAGVSIDWKLKDVADIHPPAQSGLLVANPPYGHRLGQDVRGVYDAFGFSLRERFVGWRALFLAPAEDLARRVHRDAHCLTIFSNGGLRVGLFAVEG